MSALGPAMSRPITTLLVIVAVALGARLWALQGSSERNMEPDSAHFLNVARCFARGESFSNPAAYPAWKTPQTVALPMPETFKDPAYPFAISILQRWVGDDWRAGVLISFFAGMLLPFLLYALARNLELDCPTATLAALFVAVNPLAIGMSVQVMADALFPATVIGALAIAAWRPRCGSRPLGSDLALGLVFGIALMVRNQALVALPAVLLLLLARHSSREAWRGAAVGLGTAMVTASPLLIRNLQLFGVPIYSEVGAWAVLPHVDAVTFHTSLEPPPAPLAFALTHIPQVLRFMAASAVRFAVHILPQVIAGQPVWVLPCVTGLLLATARWRRFLFAWVYMVLVMILVFGVNWDSRYFASTMPLWAMFTALGAMWIARALGPLVVVGSLRGRHLLWATLVVTMGVQVESQRRDLERHHSDELDAARALAPFLKERLAPDESVMVIGTSYYSWFADRPSVSFVIADETRFMETVRRLRVRYVALPTSRVPDLAARFPDHRFPPAMTIDHAKPELDVTVFAIRDPVPRAASR